MNGNRMERHPFFLGNHASPILRRSMVEIEVRNVFTDMESETRLCRDIGRHGSY